MRNAIRSLSIGLFAIGLVTCADLASGTHPHALAPATLALAPKFEPSANRTVAALAQLGLQYDHVRIVIVRPPTDTLKDTTVAFHSTDAPLTLVLSVLAIPDEHLGATVQFKSGATVLFQGSATVTATPANVAGTADNAVSVAVTYVGPGATATKLTLSPGTGTYAAGIVTQFTARAFDTANVELLNVPIAWSVSDTNVATIDLSGALTPKGARGTVTVTAAFGSLSQSATLSLVPPAAGLRVAQGAAQTGRHGIQLPLPVIVELVAADGFPGLSSGLTATFVANNGGSVSPASVAFGPEGRAQSFFTLGSIAGGINLYTVTAGSFPPIIVPEIAVVGPPTQLIPSGSTTLTVTAGVAPNPVPTFRVADVNGDSVAGVPLTVTLSKGTTGTQTFSFISDTIGLVNLSALVPTAAGTFTATFASGSANVSFPSLTYTLIVVPGAPAKLAFDIVPTTTAPGGFLSPSVGVSIQDRFGNRVTSSTASVTIALDLTTGSGELLGGTPTTVSAVSGFASFTTLLKITPTTTVGVKLTASSTGLTSALSAPIIITP
jgi:hypothetical protein